MVAVIRRNKIITWIHDYPNWKMNFDSKKWWEVKFFLWNQSINSFIPIRRMHLRSLIMKRKEIILWIRVCQNWPTNINSKNGGKRCFPYETKSSLPFIPIRRMCFWCQITKRKEDYYANVCFSNWKTNIKSKNGKKRCFLYETKASISFILMRRMCFWCRITKRKNRLLCESMFIQLKNEL